MCRHVSGVLKIKMSFLNFFFQIDAFLYHFLSSKRVTSRRPRPWSESHVTASPTMVRESRHGVPDHGQRVTSRRPRPWSESHVTASPTMVNRHFPILFRGVSARRGSTDHSWIPDRWSNQRPVHMRNELSHLGRRQHVHSLVQRHLPADDKPIYSPLYS